MNDKKSEIIMLEENLDNFDLSTLEHYVEELENRFANIVVTESSYNSLKKNRSEFNKLISALNKKKQNFKNEILEPYQDIFAQYDAYVERIDECKCNIDNGIKKIDENEKLKKFEKILEFFNEIKDFGNFNFELEDIFDKKWLNKSVSENIWKKELNDAAVIFQNYMNSKNTIDKNENLIFSVKINNLQKDKLINFLYENNIDFSIINDK